eukprot:14047981-Ditylum_brightwellii.AAC.1
MDDSGRVNCEEEMTPNESKYGNMIVDECSEDDEDDVIDKCLSARLILGHRTGYECYGRVAK